MPAGVGVHGALVGFVSSRIDDVRKPVICEDTRSLKPPQPSASRPARTAVQAPGRCHAARLSQGCLYPSRPMWFAKPQDSRRNQTSRDHAGRVRQPARAPAVPACPGAVLVVPAWMINDRGLVPNVHG